MVNLMPLVSGLPSLGGVGGGEGGALPPDSLRKSSDARPWDEVASVLCAVVAWYERLTRRKGLACE